MQKLIKEHLSSEIHVSLRKFKILLINKYEIYGAGLRSCWVALCAACTIPGTEYFLNPKAIGLPIRVQLKM